NFFSRSFELKFYLTLTRCCFAFQRGAPCQWGRIIGRSDFSATLFLKKIAKKRLFEQKENNPNIKQTKTPALGGCFAILSLDKVYKLKLILDT
ncbi:hypothetical protein CWB89_22915, partial [Pseudoalteromonas piscicida]